MEKLVYVIWRRGDTSPDALREALLREVAPRLLAPRARVRGLTCNVADVRAALVDSVPLRDDANLPAATVAVWLDSLDERAVIEEALAPQAARCAGYLVTESVPRDYDTRSWNDGERTPGAKLVTFFEKPARLDDEAFFARWHGSHTPLSLTIHPMWAYVRHAVSRALTPGAPPWRGIVDEQFRTLEDIVDPNRFYGSRERMHENMKRVLDDVRTFLDLERIQSVVMSEWILRSRT